MYESFFDLSSRPFPAAPVVQYYFPTAVVEQARQTLIRIVDRAEGPGLIIGQPGLGKTLLLRMLDHHFQNVFHCIHLASAAIESRKDLLQNVLFELDLPYRNMEEGELRLSLLDFLRPSENCPHGVLLLVDEAHTLPLQLLDEIRMITNLVRDGQPRVRLVLAGDTQLDDVFADPRLDSFNQRIAARCYLEPLNQEQTIEYVQSQIATIGGNPSSIFTHDALVAVYRASGGIPRLINQVCDHSLVMASLGGYHQLDASGIEEAWSDLQQLPGPWSGPEVTENASGESIVEFGSLDETPTAEASDAAVPTSAATPEVALEVTNVLPACPTGKATVIEQDPVTAGSEIELAPVTANESTTDRVDAVNAVSFEIHETVATSDSKQLPDPGNENPMLDANVDLDLLSANSPVSEPAAPTEQAAPGESEAAPLPTEQLIADYYSSNVVEVGWDAGAAESIAAPDAESVPLTSVPAPVADVPWAEVPIVQVPVAETPVADSPEIKLPVAETPTLPTDATPTDATQTDAIESEPAALEPTTLKSPLVEPKFEDPFGHGFVEEEDVIDRYAATNGSVFAGCPRVSSEEGRALAAIIDQAPSPQLSVVHEESADDTVTQASTDASETTGKSTSEVTADQASETAEVGELSTESLATNVYDATSLSDWLFESTTETVVSSGVTERNEATENPAPAAPNASHEAPSPESPDATNTTEPSAVESVPTATNSTSVDHPVALPLNQGAAEPAFLQVHEGPNYTDDRDMIVIDHDKNDGVFLTQSGDDLARRVEYQQLFSQLREG